MNTGHENGLLLNLNKLHTTDLGAARIRKNLSLDTNDVVSWCKTEIQKPDSSITREGKNWYVHIDNCVITVNAYSYTIITAHVVKGFEGTDSCRFDNLLKRKESLKVMIDTAAVKNKIVEIGRRMYEKGYVVANDGNISLRADGESVWVTPSGVSKGDMEPDMLVRMTLDGRMLEGKCKPSSEVKMHLRVYRENPAVNAVVHAHPPIATAFAASGCSLEETILSETAMLLGRIPLVPYATPGTEEVPDSIAPYCKTHCALLLANHGTITWGKTLEEAYFRLEELEQTARIHLISKYIIKSPHPLTKEQIDRLPKFF